MSTQLSADDSTHTERPPRYCPTCGQDLSEDPYYQLKPGRSARVLRKIATILLPIMAAFYLVLLFQGDIDLGFGTGAGYFALAVICGPSAVLYALSLLLPQRRLVICLHCSWFQEYPLAHPVQSPG